MTNHPHPVVRHRQISPHSFSVNYSVNMLRVVARAGSAGLTALRGAAHVRSMSAAAAAEGPVRKSSPYQSQKIRAGTHRTPWPDDDEVFVSTN